MTFGLLCIPQESPQKDGDVEDRQVKYKFKFFYRSFLKKTLFACNLYKGKVSRQNMQTMLCTAWGRGNENSERMG